MADLAACTIASKRFLAYARVLARSFRELHPEVPFFVLLADEVDGRFDPAEEPFRMLELDDLDLAGREVFCFRHAPQPLSYASTPFLLAALLDRGHRRIAFFKQESLVVGELAPTFEKLRRCSIALTPHLTEPLTGDDAADRELQVLRSGVYNVGFLGVSNRPQARRFLSWWQDRVTMHAHHDPAAGLHYEQRWLDLAPSYFDEVELLRDPGDNVGHWNQPERRIELRGGRVLVNGESARLVRFSGYDPHRPERVTQHFQRLATSDLGDGAALFELYRQRLLAEGYDETRRWPYAFESFDNGVAIPAVAREMHRELGDDAERFGDPFDTGGAPCFFDWLIQSPTAAADTSGVAPARLWLGIHRRRADLQAAFPDPAGVDRASFVEWISSSGAKEHAVDSAFLPERRVKRR